MNAKESASCFSFAVFEYGCEVRITETGGEIGERERDQECGDLMKLSSLSAYYNAGIHRREIRFRERLLAFRQSGASRHCVSAKLYWIRAAPRETLETMSVYRQREAEEG